MRLSMFGALAAGAVLLTGCATAQRMTHLGSSPCHNTTVTLYFETGSDQLPDAGRQIIAATAQRLKRCQVQDLTILGLADPTGSSQTNLELSKQRASNVLDAFVNAGLPVPKFTLTAAGDKGSVDASGAVEPVRRRVDVTVVVKR